jgi:hypothetical protein
MAQDSISDLDQRMRYAMIEVSYREFSDLKSQFAVLATKLDAVLLQSSSLVLLEKRIAALETVGVVATSERLDSAWFCPVRHVTQERPLLAPNRPDLTACVSGRPLTQGGPIETPAQEPIDSLGSGSGARAGASAAVRSAR